MAHKMQKLRDRMTPDQRARAAAQARAILAEIPLSQLRRARHLSQVALAQAMGLPQSNISRIENQTDTYLSTLRNYISALHGRLRIIAEFPEGSYEISQFEEIGAPEEAAF